MNKENLQKQIEEMKTKLADMEAELNKPEVVVNYWQPEESQRYYSVNNLGLIDSSGYNEAFHKDKARYRVFKIREEAEKYAEYVKAEETLRRVIAEANEGWIPDWTKNDEPKYVVILYTDKLNVFIYEATKYLPNFMYIKSKKLANNLMKEYDEEFKTYLSY